MTATGFISWQEKLIADQLKLVIQTNSIKKLNDQHNNVHIICSSCNKRHIMLHSESDEVLTYIIAFLPAKWDISFGWQEGCNVSSHYLTMTLTAYITHSLSYIRNLIFGEGFRFLNFSILKAWPSFKIHRNSFLKIHKVQESWTFT